MRRIATRITDMTMEFGGRKMSFEQQSSGRRIGPCD